MQLPLFAQQATPQERPETLAFSVGISNSFTFNTGLLRGKLHADGQAKGLSAVLHQPTGIELDRSLGLFSHYRVFTVNKRYGVAAWEWPSQARLERDGTVTVTWASSQERPFELRANYRWAAPNIFDVETTVSAVEKLERFESFLASYFSPDFTNSLVYARDLNPGRAGFVQAEKKLGSWLAFPRDDVAALILRDGRWKLLPNPVDWIQQPPFAKPLAIRRAMSAGLTAVLMAPPSDCFAICTPEQNDPHHSLYLCLFGQDILAGQTVRARTRLLIGTHLSDAEVLAAYEAYLKDVGARSAAK